ncbi:glutathione S-transferase family protein [Brevundimonas sp. SORGH_AS_0993]|uniref:glutathione S-transferase family protein n=1 Tax=Brevundimonas sp. SORGH_AS_0993 TaxID=3041794 RepID=UPI00277F9DD6|nr:glutathione S-transferase family protein [Brevundimonas sp. SORGH_AS_0993]MDQ1152943.1 glutathione S-transferase [Brevundimonas sp. SORGH_AS_0993]
MRLYYHPLSTCSRRVTLAAHHLGIDLDLVVVDLFRDEQNAPAFLAMNPNHRVPVLDDNGFVLWESYAIMQYLADMTPGQSLWPADPQGRADIGRWLFWCGQDFMPGCSLLNWENSIKALGGMGPADAVQVARGEALLGAAAAVLDRHLEGRTWIGADLSLADLAVAAPLADQSRARFPVSDLANLQRWFRQVQALDCWRATEPA